MNHLTKRILGMFLAMLMIVSVVPVNVFAADPWVVGDTTTTQVSVGATAIVPEGDIPEGTVWIQEAGPEKELTCDKHEHGTDCSYSTCEHYLRVQDGNPLHMADCFAGDPATWVVCDETGHTANTIIKEKLSVSDLTDSKLNDAREQFIADYMDAWETANPKPSGSSWSADVWKWNARRAAKLLEAGNEANKTTFCFTPANGPTCGHGETCTADCCRYEDHTHGTECYADKYTWKLAYQRFNVMFNLNGATSGAIDMQTVEWGSVAVKPADPQLDKYVFAGWNNGNSAYDFDTPVVSDLVLTATWKIDNNADGLADEDQTYTVVYDLGYAPEEGSRVLLSQDGLAWGAATPAPTADPTREGFKFAGWIPQVAEVIAAPAEGTTITYTADWTALGQFAVTFWDGDQQVSKQTFYKDDTTPNTVAVKMPENPVDTNDDDRLFLGWFDESGKQYTADFVPADELKITAKWAVDANNNGVNDKEEAHYTVIYNDGAANGAAFADEKHPDVLIGLATPAFSQAVPVWAGHTFTGWTPTVAETVGGEALTITYTATWINDANANGVEDAKESVKVTSKGTGTTTINGEPATETYLYDSTKVSALTLKAQPGQGSYVQSIVRNGAEQALSFVGGRAAELALVAGDEVVVTYVYADLAAHDGAMNYYANQQIVDLKGDIFAATVDGATCSPAMTAADVKIEYLYVNTTVGNYEIKLWGDPEAIMTPEAIGAAIKEQFSWLPALIVDPIVEKAAEYYHAFGEQETERIRITYAGNEQYPMMQREVDLALKDLRIPTEIVFTNNISIVYNADKSVMEAAIREQLNASVLELGTLNAVPGATVKFTYDLDGLNAGEEVIGLAYVGSATHKPSKAEATITVERAPADVSVKSEVVKYTANYDANQNITVDPANVKLIKFVVGLNVADGHFENQRPTGVKTALNLIMPEIKLPIIGAVNWPTTTLTSDQLLALLDTVKDALPAETSGALINTISTLAEQLGELEITINGEMPKDIGVYLIGAITADLNYETALGIGALAITPDGYRAELDWKIDDENGFVTLPAIQSGNYDLGAYVTKVYEGTVEEAERELVNLFIGIGIDGKVTVTKDQKQLLPGAYTEISYILNWGNTMYYAMPIARVLMVVAEPVNVQFIDAYGVINGDRLFTYDGKPHALDVAVFDVNGNDITAQINRDNLTVTYYGVRSSGEKYESKEAPFHAGAYTAVATYVERDANGMFIRGGMDVAVMLIKPNAEATITVDDKTYIYDGNKVDVNTMITKTPEDAKVAIIMASLADNRDFSVNGFDAIDGNVNIDFPARADEILIKHYPTAYTTGISADSFIYKINQYSAELAAIGFSSEKLQQIIDLLDQMPDNLTLTFKEQADVNPANIGGYLIAGVIFDPDYMPKVDLGVLLIAPAVEQAVLQWNVEDANGIITLPILPVFDFGANATVAGAENDALTAKIKYVFIGISDEGELIETNDATTLPAGVYTEIAYLEPELGASMAIAKPIMRSFIVTARAVNVTFVDETGAPNADRLFVYDGKPHAMPVVVTDMVTGEPITGELLNNLTVTYIGLDGHGKGYNSVVAPTEAGAYTVIASYVEKTADGKLYRVGMAIGAMVIQKTDLEFDLLDTKVPCDGNEHFVDVVNKLGADYVAVVVDEKNSTANVILPADLNALAQALAEKLGYAAPSSVSVDVTALKAAVADLLAQADALAAKLPESMLPTAQNVLAKLNEILASIPDGTVTINGKKPVAVGVYEIHALTYSANYKSIYDKATLTIYQAYTVTFDAQKGTVEPVSAVTGPDGKLTLAALPTPVREDYIFAGWFTAADGGVEVKIDQVYTADTILYARWIQPTVTYTITWVNYDGKVLDQVGVMAGFKPVFKGATPVKPEDDKFTYVFSGWTPEVVPATADQVYTATFTALEKKTYYTIIWNDDDGKELYRATVKSGETPVYPYANPTKAENVYFTYVFSGWTPEVVPAVADQVYTAKYTEVQKEYTITWKNYDGTVLYTEKVKAGETPEYQGTPVRPDDLLYTYTFKGWSPKVGQALADCVYTATYGQEWKMLTLTGVTQLRVLDAETEAYVAGATFELYRYNAEGKRIYHGTYTTNENGLITVRALSSRYSYEFVQIGAPEGYVLETETIRFNIRLNHPLHQTLLLEKVAAEVPAEPAK